MSSTQPGRAPGGALALRLVLIAVGVLVGVYGAYLLLRLGGDNLVSTLYWLAGGVVLHDGVVGLALIGIGALVVLVPGRVRGPVAAGLVVLGTVTATAIPVLSGLGEKAYKPTLLDRDYPLGWLVLAVLVAVGTGVGVVRALRRDRAGAAYGDTVREPHDEVDPG